MIDNIIIDNTLVDVPRLESIINLLGEVKELDGEIAEVGVYKGGTARLIAKMCRNTHLHLIDTFEGLPQENSFDNFHKKGDFNDTSIEHVLSILPDCNAWIYKGIFPKDKEIFDALKDIKFKFAHIDVDIYDSVYECLEFFYPRMVKGGVIKLDDYSAPTCAGARLATDRFVEENSLELIVGPSCSAHIYVR